MPMNSQATTIGPQHPGLFSMVVWGAMAAAAAAVKGKGAVPADIQPKFGCRKTFRKQ
jgi:hypothetical protein